MNQKTYYQVLGFCFYFILVQFASITIMHLFANIADSSCLNHQTLTQTDRWAKMSCNQNTVLQVNSMSVVESFNRNIHDLEYQLSVKNAMLALLDFN